MWMDNIAGIDLFVIIDGEIRLDIGLEISFLTQDRRQEHGHMGIPLITLRIGRVPWFANVGTCMFVHQDRRYMTELLISNSSFVEKR